MRISTRTRYGLRLMIYLAKSYNEGNILLKDIAKDEDISEKYLSLIIIPLRSAQLVRSVRGARGGYSIAREPSKIKVSEVVTVLEGDLALIECVNSEGLCDRQPDCDSYFIWENLSKMIEKYLGTITLEDLIHHSSSKIINYNI